MSSSGPVTHRSTAAESHSERTTAASAPHPAEAVESYRSTPPPARVPWSTVALTAILAAAANLGLYLLAGATGTELRAPMGQGGEIVDLPVLPVPIVSVVGVVAAAVALRVVQRLLPGRAWGAWLGLVGLGFVLSLAPMAAVPAESVPWLVAMHALVAVAVVTLIGRRARSR